MPALTKTAILDCMGPCQMSKELKSRFLVQHKFALGGRRQGRGGESSNFLRYLDLSSVQDTNALSLPAATKLWPR